MTIIIDKNTKVITLNLRDENNNNFVTKSYQVFSAKEIFDKTLNIVFDELIFCKKEDAQMIILAICILVIDKSTYYNKNENGYNIVDEIIDDNDLSDTLRVVVKLIQDESSQLSFVKKAIKYAFEYNRRYPYNDSEIVDVPIELPEKFPEKFLQTIEINVWSLV